MFKKYEYIYAVYEEKNFTRAAEKLYISQPSLSAAVKNIENKVGAPLFERSSHGVIPTPIGEEYIEACKKILNVENEFESRLNDIYNLETGCIKVGGTNYLSSYVLPKIINRFKERYPKIEVVLTEAKSVDLNEMLKAEELDIVVDGFDFVPDMYQGHPLLNEKILLCVPFEWEINDDLREFVLYPEDIYNGNIDIENIPPVPIDIFKNENFILLKDGNDMYARASKIFEDSGIDPIVSFYVDQLNISYALSQSGIGICFETDTFFRYCNYNKNISLYNVEKKYCNRTLYIVHNKHKYCSSAMKKFISIAREVITGNK